MAIKLLIILSILLNKYNLCQLNPGASNIGHWKIVIDFYHNSMRFPNMAFVQAKNIFYNTNLTSEYDPNLRKIAIVITDQPVVADNNKTLLVGTAQLAYEEVSGYNRKNQIKKIASTNAEYQTTDFSKCFMSPVKGKNIVARCSDLSLSYILNKPTLNSYKQSVVNFKFEVVDDLKQQENSAIAIKHLIIEGEKINFDEFMGEEFDTIENNYNTWLVNFVRCVDNIYINFYHNSMRFPNMAFVQAKNIFYNTKLTSEYDTNLRKIAIVITDQPIVADNNKTLLVGTAQLAYEEVSGYNEENQIKKIVKRKADYEDTNFSKCFMSPIKGKNIIVRCTELRPTYSTCQLQKTDYVISQYDNLLDFLMCHVSSSKTKVFLVGVLSRVNKLSLNSYGQIIHLKFENVDDLGRIVQRKMRKWLAENPEQKTYSLW
ncbi:Protein of unknown function [Cotesia congregata]|uniref:Uncharacterized protein n=1 Tax=Cotesia congregata TaxID=51543 RepID=A0A8J2HDA2_COTCN|nr:Protein of unknown function [Cotesia congregata]